MTSTLTTTSNPIPTSSTFIPTIPSIHTTYFTLSNTYLSYHQTSSVPSELPEEPKPGEQVAESTWSPVQAAHEKRISVEQLDFSMPPPSLHSNFR